MNVHFWEKELSSLSQNEWEQLCDACGRCCLHKFQDEDTKELLFTRVACRLLDTTNCRCSSYQKRFDLVQDCVDIRNFSAEQYAWLPETCAYRLRFEGKALPAWHPLLTGRAESVVEAGISMRGNTIAEDDIQLDDLEAYIDEDIS